MASEKVETKFLNSPEEGLKGFHWEVLRPLNDDEFAALKRGIEEDGIVSSIVLDRDGNIIDGGHRLKAWKLLREEGIDMPRAPVQIRHDIGSDDEGPAKLLARKLNMQRRQLTNLEKVQVIKDQLRETWERSDSWIATDLGVSDKQVKARRNDLIKESSSVFPNLPEKVFTRAGKWDQYAKPKKKKKKSASKSEAGTETIGTTMQAAKDEMSQNGAPENAPGWPRHPSREPVNEANQVVSKIIRDMATLSRHEPSDIADEVSARADVQARIATAEGVIEWFSKYKEELEAKLHERHLSSIQ